MKIEFLYILLSTLCLAVDFCFDKVYQNKVGSTAVSGFRYTAIVGFFATIMFFIMNDCKFAITPISAIIAIVSALIVVGYKIIGIKILKEGSIAIYTIFLMSGGMIVPYVWGICFFGEPFSWFKTVGLILITIAVIIAYYGKGKFSKKQLFLCIAVFIINGFSSVFGKLHQIQDPSVIVDSESFSMLTAIFRCFISGVVFLFLRAKSKEETKPAPKSMYIIFVLSAVFGGLAGLFNVMSAISVPATMLYPLITGGTIIFSCLAGWLVFKETITKKLVLGLCVCMIGIAGFMF